uniref:Uncharacterized protein n=1 Tax=Arundo donax TaxID=35708 RepID=A0A0A9AR62_ARUDO
MEDREVGSVILGKLEEQREFQRLAAVPSACLQSCDAPPSLLQGTATPLGDLYSPQSTHKCIYSIYPGASKHHYIDARVHFME